MAIFDRLKIRRFRKRVPCTEMPPGGVRRDHGVERRSPRPLVAGPDRLPVRDPFFAEFERALIRERVNGRPGTEAWHKDRPFGRPKIDAAVEARSRKSLLKGAGTKETASAVGVWVGTVVRVKPARGCPGPVGPSPPRRNRVGVVSKGGPENASHLAPGPSVLVSG